MFVRSELMAAVRAICASEYEQSLQEPWDPKRYASLAVWRVRYARMKTIGTLFAEVKANLRRIERLEPEGLNLPLTSWVRAGQDITFRAPASLRALVVEYLEFVPAPAAAPTDMPWEPRRRRRLTPRELACITLLLGMVPDLPSGGVQPADVIRREANAIRQIQSRGARRD
jgi:hypothetical protein